jgi:uncharacterized protein YerC
MYQKFEAHLNSLQDKGVIQYYDDNCTKTEINYIPEKTSFLVASMFSAGATAIDAEGIVSIVARETA